ncbi:MAG: PD-(D/E)XK nuclease family protein, partial [Deltaproteobacteria bacterium]|nr:PD-(D/E)XK nuclease family protein [Deltaproteobacteria bacterium]
MTSIYSEKDLVVLARAGQLKGVVKKPPRISATTIQNFADCERRFYWAALAGLDTPPSESMKFGTKLHVHQERWLKHGTPQGDDAPGKLASLGAMLLPRPKAPGLAVEES